MVLPLPPTHCDYCTTVWISRQSSTMVCAQHNNYFCLTWNLLEGIVRVSSAASCFTNYLSGCWASYLLWSSWYSFCSRYSITSVCETQSCEPMHTYVYMHVHVCCLVTTFIASHGGVYWMLERAASYYQICCQPLIRVHLTLHLIDPN